MSSQSPLQGSSHKEEQVHVRWVQGCWHCARCLGDIHGGYSQYRASSGLREPSRSPLVSTSFDFHMSYGPHALLVARAALRQPSVWLSAGLSVDVPFSSVQWECREFR